MYGSFTSIPVPGHANLSIVEPPAGLTVAINERIKLYSDGENKLTTVVWSAIFVLSCLHEENGDTVQPSVCVIASQLGYEHYNTLKSVFVDATDDEFKDIVDDFVFNIARPTLEAWFNLVDSNQLISKKKVDDAKND